MRLAEAYHIFLMELDPLYAKREARRIADIVFEKLTGYTPTARIIHKEKTLGPERKAELDKIRTALLASVPLQYVLKEAWFFGMPFYVDNAVLIPRPETEELVEWVLAHAGGSERVLDIGTGSGCIAITLKKRNPLLRVSAMEKYSNALRVARSNATALGADIQFIRADVLEYTGDDPLPSQDILVSNPPYIPFREREEMDKQVAGQEPDTALFVPDEDPLIFYKAILQMGVKKLKPGGKVFVEIHEDLGTAVKELFEKQLSNVILKKDLSGKDRMVFGTGR